MRPWRPCNHHQALETTESTIHGMCFPFWQWRNYIYAVNLSSPWRIGKFSQTSPEDLTFLFGIAHWILEWWLCISPQRLQNSFQECRAGRFQMQGILTVVTSNVACLRRSQNRFMVDNKTLKFLSVYHFSKSKSFSGPSPRTHDKIATSFSRQHSRLALIEDKYIPT